MNSLLLKKQIGNFGKLKILVFGDVMLDHYIITDVSRLSPEAPVPIAHTVEEKFSLGGAANVAHNLQQIGIQTHILGQVGADSGGKQLDEMLKSLNISVEGLLVRDDIPTTQKTRIVAQQQQLLRIDREDPKAPSKELVKKQVSYLEKIIPTIDAVIISDYAKGSVNQDMVEKIMDLSRVKKIPVIGDPKPANQIFYKGVTVLLPNHQEAEQLAMMKESPEVPLKEIAAAIQKKYDCNLIITCGARGMKVFSSEGIFDVHSRARQVFDVTGAGDKVTALVGAGLAGGMSLEDAAVLASVGAGLVVEKFGTATVTPEELLAAL